MKLEKREITLNEQDSLKDAIHFEKILLKCYVETLAAATRKSARGELLQYMKEVGEDMGYLADLLRKSAK
jgi:hypothetical protein